MRIAVFDYFTTPNNPIGSCVLEMIAGLHTEHEFTVFSRDFTNPCPGRVGWVRVPVVRRPLALLFLSYHLLAPLFFVWHRLRHNQRYDLVLITEDCLAFGHVTYAQFCHRSYLKHHWKQTRAPGLRSALRWLDHQLRALFEPWVYRYARRIVAPSRGLACELVQEYPFVREKLCVIPNPVDSKRMHIDAAFDRAGFRQALGFSSEDTVLVFVALGHFERKGLPLLLETLAGLGDGTLKLLVVGGEADLVAAYRASAKRMGLADRVIFTGMQRDVRPYLWSADAFAFPSRYETFSLVSFQAAAAGLPLIVSSFFGVEEFLRDGQNGIVIAPTAAGVQQGVARYLALPLAARQAMGEQARQDTARYDTAHFVHAWRSFYAHNLPHSAPFEESVGR